MISGYFIAIIIILSVLLFGSINTWAFAIVGSMIVLFFNGWLYQNKNRVHVPSELWERILIISITGFIFLCLFQVIPLPLSLIKILSPSFYHLLKEMSFNMSFRTISFYPYVTINETLKILVYLMLFIMTASLANDRDAIRKMIIILVVFGFIISCFGIIQKATWNGKIYWFVELTRGGSLFGPFVNRNHFAGFMGMVVPLGLGMVLENRILEKKLIYMFFSLIMAVGILLSLSRGGIMSFLLSISLFFILTSIRNVKKNSIVYLLGFLLLLFCYLFYIGISPVINRFATQGLESQRPLVWRGTLEAIQDFPWFGTGLGTFKFAFPMYSPQELSHTVTYHYAHNDYLQLLLETGILGGLFMTLFFISIIAIIVKYQKARKFSPLMAGLIASMTHMIVHSLVDFNLHMPSNAMMFSVILGLIVACSKKKESYPHLTRIV